jgi:hypothetical protein
MAGAVVSYLLEPPAKAYGADLAVAVAIADRCDADGRGCWAGVEDLARRANLCHFGEVDKTDPDYRRIRENAMRSGRRSLGNLAAAGVVFEEGASRHGTVNRGIVMTDTMSGPDTMSAPSAPVDLPDGHHVRDPDTVSEEKDTTSVLPDTVSPKPSLEPSSKPSEKQPSPSDAPRLTPPVHPGGDEDVARVEAQRLHNASVPTDPIISGLSPSSTGSAGPTPAQIKAEHAEKVAELAACDQMLAEGRGGSMTRAMAAELRDELGIEVAA